MAKTITIGLMSGTSLDGVDALAVDFAQVEKPRVIGHFHLPYSESLKKTLLQLCTPGDNEIDTAGDASVELANVYAEAILQLLDKARVNRSQVLAAGIHGQTIRHRPQAHWSLQLNAPAHVAEIAGIDIVSDFRARDLAAGGQGAPLVPAFHRQIFSGDVSRAIVNIGGIANATLLPGKNCYGNILGFDCGPGNVLLDAWSQAQRHEPFDKDGTWAASGRIDEALLRKLLSHPYFQKVPPKSTGREDFNLAWLKNFVGAEKPEDVERTLVALTATGIVQSVTNYLPDAEEVYLCGGGAFNQTLRQEIAERFGASIHVGSTAELGIDPMYVEAMTFAWLTWAFFQRDAGNLREVTGAAGARVLGALYPH